MKIIVWGMIYYYLLPTTMGIMQNKYTVPFLATAFLAL